MRQKYQRNDYPVVHGAFGEMENCDALPKEIVHEDGLKMRLYGTPYLYKGLSDVRVVAGLQFPKALFSSFLREAILKSWLNIAFLGFKYLFDRQSFLYSVYFLFHQIDQKVLKWYEPQIEDFNPFARELRRAMEKAVCDMTHIWAKIMRLAIRFFCLFLEVDNGYRYRVQDGLQEKKTNGISEFWRIYGIIESRENGIKTTWKFIRYALKAALIFDPTLKKILVRFFNELDVEKIRMDESDIFYSRKFPSYNFGGSTIEERLKQFDEMCKKSGFARFI